MTPASSWDGWAVVERAKVVQVWRQLREKLEGSYGSLVQHGAALYPSVQVPQTPEALRALLITLG